jgi:hypothetical protein
MDAWRWDGWMEGRRKGDMDGWSKFESVSCKTQILRCWCRRRACMAGCIRAGPTKARGVMQRRVKLFVGCADGWSRNCGGQDGEGGSGVAGARVSPELSFLFKMGSTSVRFEVPDEGQRLVARVSLTVCATHRGPFLKQTVTIAVDAAQDTLTRTLYATMSVCARARSFQVVGAHRESLIHIWKLVGWVEGPEVGEVGVGAHLGHCLVFLDTIRRRCHHGILPTCVRHRCHPLF